MRHRSWPLGIVAVACGLMAGATTAPAAAIQTWVSGTGTDAGDCPVTAPCRTFQYAHGQTSVGGVISVLSAGDFGPLVIRKSISIVAEGVEALILGAGAANAAITIQAGANDIVSLRGLTIDMRGTGKTGIVFFSGAALHVQNCAIRRSVHGISAQLSSGTTSKLHVSDTAVADTSDNGINVFVGSTAIAKVVLDRVRVENAGQSGVRAAGRGSVTATVRDSVLKGNANAGINAGVIGTGIVTVMVDRTVVVDGFRGVSAAGGTTIRIGDSTVTGNATGLFTAGNGVIASYGTNTVNGNGTDGVPTSTIAMK